MFGEFVREKRIQQGLTLREFCKILNFDPSNWSKIEREKAQPPQSRDMLDKIADLLNLAAGSQDRLKFYDLASLQGGRIPGDILNDKELVENLPLVFRTIRGEKPSRQEMEKLIDLIKGED